MDGFLLVLVLATLPALGYIGGGLLAEAVIATPRTLSFALHAAAGVVFAIVAVELMPRVLEATIPWVVVLAFVLGALFFIGLDLANHFIQARLGASPESSGPYTIFLGVAIELLNDGIMVGAGTTITPALGFLLALGQVPANVPQAFATIATFKARGVARLRRILLTLALGIPVVLGATVGYFAVLGQPDLLKQTVLAFTAGALVILIVEEIMPEAHREWDAHVTSLAFISGFVVFMLISAYLG